MSSGIWLGQGWSGLRCEGFACFGPYLPWGTMRSSMLTVVMERDGDWCLSGEIRGLFVLEGGYFEVIGGVG